MSTRGGSDAANVADSLATLRAMPDPELKAAGALAAEYADRALISPIQAMHVGVAERVFRATGPGAAPARALHDALSRGAYNAIRAGATGVGAAVGAAARLAGGEEERTSLSDSKLGRGVQAAVNGLIGDRLAEDQNPLRIEMALRLPGRDVEVSREGLERAFEHTTSRLVVFLHGLCEGEEGWWLGTRADPDAPDGAARTYGQRLRDDLGFTPLYLRYNSGLHVSANGRELSWMLEQLCREWPGEIEEIALVGHSMGGLVARSACHEAAEAERRWLDHVTHLVCLGSPNTGSWLEKVVHVGTSAMRRAPETRGIAGFFELRSAGIRDLRFGYLRDEDWLEADADEWLNDRSQPLAPVPGIAHHFVSASLAPGDRHPLAALFGDILVRRESATGPRTPDGTPAGDSRHVEGATHFRLLNHPVVYEHLREWLSEPPSGAGVEVEEGGAVLSFET